MAMVIARRRVRAASQADVGKARRHRQTQKRRKRATAETRRRVALRGLRHRRDHRYWFLFVVQGIYQGLVPHQAIRLRRDHRVRDLLRRRPGDRAHPRAWVR